MRCSKILFYETNEDAKTMRCGRERSDAKRVGLKNHDRLSFSVCGMIPLVAGTFSSLYDYCPWSV